MLQTNVVGVFNTCKQAAKLMNENPDGLTKDNLRGVIINTASVAAFDGQIGKRLTGNKAVFSQDFIIAACSEIIAGAHKLQTRPSLQGNLTYYLD